MMFVHLLSQTQRHARAGAGWPTPAATATSAARPQPPATPSVLLARALREDSNVALDWLWYAQRVSSAEEQEFCRALARWIDPRAAR